mmetsp:Transcript_7293/g.11094  ORF Transcript_7293/g.11094 Transcript_7293/m.11094 type:complete len:214 (-) Transcript_7293:165-806(-)
MQIFVTGNDGKSMTLDVSTHAKVGDVAAMIEERTGLLPEQQVLSFAGKALSHLLTLSAYSVEGGSTLHLSLRILGGHCQVPCGIFDDPKTVAEIKEACTTIRKAMVQINELSKKGDALSFNQMTRWVMTKEEHCKNIITTISEYCLCQRVKPFGAAKSPFKSDKDFVDALKAHHAVMIAAMKAKQNVDLGFAHKLEHAVGDWSLMYVPEEKKQ